MFNHLLFLDDWNLVLIWQVLNSFLNFVLFMTIFLYMKTGLNGDFFILNWELTQFICYFKDL